jgi:hypothetical protein
MRCLERARDNSCTLDIRTNLPTYTVVVDLGVPGCDSMSQGQWVLGVSNVQRALKIPATPCHILLDLNPQQHQRQPQIPSYMTAILVI